jgi:hypothetical protein
METSTHDRAQDGSESVVVSLYYLPRQRRRRSTILMIRRPESRATPENTASKTSRSTTAANYSTSFLSTLMVSCSQNIGEDVLLPTSIYDYLLYSPYNKTKKKKRTPSHLPSPTTSYLVKRLQSEYIGRSMDYVRDPKSWEGPVVKIFRDAIELRQQRHESLESIIGVMHGYILAVDHRWYLTNRAEADAVQIRIESILFEVAHDRVPLLETRS